MWPHEPKISEGVCLRQIRLWWTSTWLCIGPIPSYIFELTNLQDLRLFDNLLTGRYFHILVYANRYFHILVLTLYRTNSIWNRQIDELAGASSLRKSADWSVFQQFYPMIIEGVSIRQIRSGWTSSPAPPFPCFDLTLYRLLFFQESFLFQSSRWRQMAYSLTWVKTPDSPCL